MEEQIIRLQDKKKILLGIKKPEDSSNEEIMISRKRKSN
jgi:hypothetical protein